MTRDDIIRMAREAGFERVYLAEEAALSLLLPLERFAAKVAAAERDACAKVAQSFDPHMHWSNYGRVIANKIRERGQ